MLGSRIKRILQSVYIWISIIMSVYLLVQQHLTLPLHVQLHDALAHLHLSPQLQFPSGGHVSQHTHFPAEKGGLCRMRERKLLAEDGIKTSSN